MQKGQTDPDLVINSRYPLYKLGRVEGPEQTSVENQILHHIHQKLLIEIVWSESDLKDNFVLNFSMCLEYRKNLIYGEAFYVILCQMLCLNQ